DASTGRTGRGGDAVPERERYPSGSATLHCRERAQVNQRQPRMGLGIVARHIFPPSSWYTGWEGSAGCIELQHPIISATTTRGAPRVTCGRTWSNAVQPVRIACLYEGSVSKPTACAYIRLILPLTCGLDHRQIQIDFLGLADIAKRRY